MRGKLFLAFFFLKILICSVCGQDLLAYKAKWQTRFLTGVNIPITKLLQDIETDYLLQYKDYSYCIELPSVSYFFHKHWGVNLNLRIGGSSKLRDRTDNFIAKVQSIYGENYFVSAETNETKEVFHQPFLGVIYRLETNKFYIYPTLSIGGTAIYTNYWQAHLKEKNSNNEYGLFLSKNKSSNGLFFTVATSVSFGYKLSERVFLNADVMFSHFSPSFMFEKEFVNLYTKESSVEYFDYKKDIFTLGLGAGLIIVIR